MFKIEYHHHFTCHITKTMFYLYDCNMNGNWSRDIWFWTQIFFVLALIFSLTYTLLPKIVWGYLHNTSKIKLFYLQILTIVLQMWYNFVVFDADSLKALWLVHNIFDKHFSYQKIPQFRLHFFEVERPVALHVTKISKFYFTTFCFSVTAN